MRFPEGDREVGQAPSSLRFGRPAVTTMTLSVYNISLKDSKRQDTFVGTIDIILV